MVAATNEDAEMHEPAPTVIWVASLPNEDKKVWEAGLKIREAGDR